MTHKILVIEDDRDIAQLVHLHLRDAGYDVTLLHDGMEGLKQALAQPYGLIILDLMLPGMPGLEICRRLRAQPDYVPILMLTARSSEGDRVRGLERGADDYLTKPFGIRELLARVNAIFRRGEALKTPASARKQASIEAGAVSIDPDKRIAMLNGVLLNLTAKEFDLLVQFAHNPGRVYTRAQLLDLVWGLGYEGYEHTVNSHINRLRVKIEEDAAKPKYLLTVWGVGYKFAEAEALITPPHN